MKRSVWIRVTLPIAVVAFLCGFCVCFGVIRTNREKLLNWVERVTGSSWEAQRAERRAYLEGMKQPRLSGREVAELIRKDKVIKTKELYDMADWYVYHGNRDVIRQVLINRQFEQKITLPEEQRGNPSIKSDYGIADGYNGPSWGTDREWLIRREVLHEMAAKPDVDPHFMFLLVQNAVPEFKSKAYAVYWAPLVFLDDIHALLRVYAKYKDWPTIRNLCKWQIFEYPTLWHDGKTVGEVLKLADAEGAERAFELYKERYSCNYQRFISPVRDINDPNKVHWENSIFKGWDSENMRGVLHISDVNEPGGAIAIKNVAKILSLASGDKDMTPLCRLTADNELIISLGKGKDIEYDYRIQVTPQWWEAYIARNVGDVEDLLPTEGE